MIEERMKWEMSFCKHTIKKVFQNRSLTIYGGIGTKISNFDLIKLSPDLIISLSNSIEIPSVANFIFSTKVKVIRLWTPDFNVPLLSKEDWVTLCEEIKKGKKTLVCCSGGHGRTGTVLAILGCLLDYIPRDKDPIAWVRATYCTQAVESKDQISYISHITNRKINTKLYNTPTVFVLDKQFLPQYTTLECDICREKFDAKYDSDSQLFLCSKCKVYFEKSGS